VLSLLITWHQPRNRIAWIFSAAGLAFSVDLVSLAVLAQPDLSAWLGQAAFDELYLSAGPLTVIWVSLILCFPTGGFYRDLWRRFALAAGVLCLVSSLVQFLIAPAGFLPPQYGTAAPLWLSGPFSVGELGRPLVQILSLPNLLLPFVSALGLLGRYRASEPSEQQQIKWLLLAVAFQVVIQVGVLSGLSALGVTVPGVLTLVISPLPTLGAALAIFRYRLYEVDRLIARTAAFAVLWGLTAAGSVGLGIAAGVAVGGRDVRIVGALAFALLVTLVVQPLRQWLERGIARLVYGRHPRGYAALAGFTQTLRSAVPLSDLASIVATTTRGALGVPWAGVWLRVETDGRSSLRLAGAAGEERLPSIIQADVARLRVLLPEPPGAIIPVAVGEESVGLIACGQRAGGELSGDALELLTIIARQSALVLRNLRLEKELRERLMELRESRQRLVIAHDEERRRLERDLHDGAQQQLVALATKLKQAAASSGNQRMLEECASEAEEAVFALQDLARGIYPSVLADQGLAAALRAHAVRVPLQVRVEVEPGLAERRFDPELEAAMYFVALEAVTNAHKHAGTPTVTVTLRSEAVPPSLVVEVHDNGRGFDQNTPRGGTGVQNMTDRVAALGGRIRVESRPGAGTWIRAFVPLEAEVIPFEIADRSARPLHVG
jgi:signal transduction histidine kinase